MKMMFFRQCYLFQDSQQSIMLAVSAAGGRGDGGVVITANRASKQVKPLETFPDAVSQTMMFSNADHVVSAPKPDQSISTAR